MSRPKSAKRFLSAEEDALVTSAVAEAEKRTSAEIKLVILRHCWKDLREKAAELFTRHGLDRTAQRNCVLILLVTTNREFLICGDKGIDEKVGVGFWEDVRDSMMARFREEDFAGGLVEGVALAGEKLAEHFPCRDGDVNEISDEVVEE